MQDSAHQFEGFVEMELLLQRAFVAMCSAGGAEEPSATIRGRLKLISELLATKLQRPARIELPHLTQALGTKLLEELWDEFVSFNLSRSDLSVNIWQCAFLDAFIVDRLAEDHQMPVLTDLVVLDLSWLSVVVSQSTDLTPDLVRAFQCAGAARGVVRVGPHRLARVHHNVRDLLGLSSESPWSAMEIAPQTVGFVLQPSGNIRRVLLTSGSQAGDVLSAFD
jgi:hypothetical protein